MEGTQRDDSPRKSPKDTSITVYGRMPVVEELQDDSLQRLLTRSESLENRIHSVSISSVSISADGRQLT